MPVFNDEWFYEQLKQFDLKSEVDLSNWYNHSEGPSWRGIPQTVWYQKPQSEIWKKLYKRLPHHFAREVAYLNNLSFEIARRVYPNFDTILANHAYSEWILYANLDHEKYREHIVHPFKVAVIARWLLEQTNRMKQLSANLSKANHVKDLLNRLSLKKSVFTEDNGKIIKAALWLAGLYHDLGYGHNFFCRMESRLKETYSFYKGDLVAESISGIPEKTIENSLIKKYLKPNWKTSLYENLSRNHSIAGATRCRPSRRHARVCGPCLP